MLVYETDQFRKQVNRLGVKARAHELRESIESAASLEEVRQLLDPLVPYYKDRTGKTRLIGRVQRVRGHDVFCFLGAYPRKSDDYGNFLWDRRGFGEKHLDAAIDREALELLVVDSEGDSGQVDALAEPLPEELYAWVDPPSEVVAGLAAGTGECQIYESRRWVQDMRRSQHRKYWLRIQELVVAAVEGDIEQAPSVAGHPEYRQVKGASGASVLFRPVHEGTAGPAVLLVAAFLSPPAAVDIDDALRECGLLGVTTLALEEVIRRARRSYPSYLLADEDAWQAIEEDDAANLALSGEEEDLLHTVASSGPGRGMPLFINGRAGSGKSTMLAYLFAAFVVRRLRHDLPGRPFFLTYNERLLEASKRSVQSLLLANHDLIGGDVRVELSSIDEWFCPFRTFLIDSLPVDQQRQFQPDHHISFHHFRNAYLGESARLPKLMLPERHRVYPELAWYVIRTFIKGYAASGYLDPDLYAELPRSERIVSEATFALIFESIWERWYQKASEAEVWDDQDLVLAALQHGDNSGMEPVMALVCDEAQDFTRRELQMLIRSLAITGYDLTGRHLSTMPFVLAGDPFQTLNPTGFSWKSVQAALHEELAIRVQTDVEVRLEQLENNYRSTPAIVQAINGIQLWRSVLFGVDELKPQRPWDVVPGDPPHKYILGSNIGEEEIAALIEDTIIIVPCDEGGEVDYVRGDPVLSMLYPDVDEQRPPRNVLSATTAKGSEFRRVIVWRFGDSCPVGLFDGLDEHAALEAEYFLNKLYVAASRAKQYLFIVDSVEGDERLWRHGAADALDAFAARTADPSMWSGALRSIELAPAGSSSELKETAIEDTAAALRDQGLAARNPTVLRQAAEYYRRVPDEAEARRCEAHALQFSDQQAAAGRVFESIGDKQAAFDCYWEVCDWTALDRWFSDAGSADRSLVRDRQPIVAFMAGRHDTAAIRDFTEQLRDLLDRHRVGSFLESAWREAISSFARLADSLLDGVAADDARRFAQVLHQLAGRNFENAAKVAGRGYFVAGDWAKAVECWESCGYTRSQEYRLAKCEAEGEPQGLQWLLRAGDDWGAAEVLRRWRTNGSPSDAGWLLWVAPAQEQRGDVADAFSNYTLVGNTAKCARLYSRLVRVNRGLARRSLVELATRLGADEDMRAAKSVLSAGSVFTVEYERAAASALTALVVSLQDRQWPSLEVDDRSAIEDVAKALALTPRWQRHIHPAVMGAAFEITGTHLEALRHYERFVQDADRDLRNFARQRWLKVKGDQVRQQGDSKPNRDRYRRDRARRAHDWGYKETDVFDEHPDVSRWLEVPQNEPAVVTAAEAREVIVGIEVQLGPDGTLTLLDGTDFRFYRVDLASGSADSSAGRVEAEEGLLRISFAAGASFQYLVETRQAEFRLGDEVQQRAY